VIRCVMIPHAPNQVRTVEQLASYVEAFWSKEKRNFQKRLDIPGLLTAAMKILEDDRARGIPVRNWRSLEWALRHAEKVSRAQRLVLRKAIREAALRAARAPKQDALGERIEKVTARRPDITELELLELLKAEKGLGLIVDVHGGVISFKNGKRDKASPISGLRNRLSRTKKKLRRPRPR